MTFTMTDGCKKVSDVDIVEGSHVYSSTTDYYRNWDEIPEHEQEELVRLRDELQTVFMKTMKVGKGS